MITTITRRLSSPRVDGHTAAGIRSSSHAGQYAETLYRGKDRGFSIGRWSTHRPTECKAGVGDWLLTEESSPEGGSTSVRVFHAAYTRRIKDNVYELVTERLTLNVNMNPVLLSLDSLTTPPCHVLSSTIYQARPVSRPVGQVAARDE